MLLQAAGAFVSSSSAFPIKLRCVASTSSSVSNERATTASIFSASITVPISRICPTQDRNVFRALESVAHRTVRSINLDVFVPTGTRPKAITVRVSVNVRSFEILHSAFNAICTLFCQSSASSKSDKRYPCFARKTSRRTCSFGVNAMTAALAVSFRIKSSTETISLPNDGNVLACHTKAFISFGASVSPRSTPRRCINVPPKAVIRRCKNDL